MRHTCKSEDAVEPQWATAGRSPFRLQAHMWHTRVTSVQMITTKTSPAPPGLKGTPSWTATDLQPCLLGLETLTLHLSLLTPTWEFPLADSEGEPGASYPDCARICACSGGHMHRNPPFTSQRPPRYIIKEKQELLCQTKCHHFMFMLCHLWITKYLCARPRGSIWDPFGCTGQERGNMGGVYQWFIAVINPAELWSWYSNRNTAEILWLSGRTGPESRCYKWVKFELKMYKLTNTDSK